ncbi:MAG: CehA/McbA family metallohydrolase [Betaproteobacteria bacterium]|nr:CehA/McbA family metallohydrolase [Betaproteobacteria bacterium]
MKRIPYLLCLALAVAGLARAESALHWYRGNTHTHTINSDGDSAPEVVVRWYREHDYQFLFITDHEFITDAAALNTVFGANERFLLLPGQEVTQWGLDPKRGSAHVNALFASQVVWPVGDSRCRGSGCGAFSPVAMPLGQTFDINIAAIKAEGALAQVNHPNYKWSVKPEDLFTIPDGTLLEIWNGHGAVNNLGGSDGAGDARPAAEGYWDILLSRGKIVWGVGSDDAHFFSVPEVYNPRGAAPGQAWIVVHAPELSSAAIRKAIEHGDFYASTGISLDAVDASAEKLSLTIHEARAGVVRYTTRFIGKDGKPLAEVAGAAPSYKFTGTESYVRAAVMDSNGRRAWTQPVFLDGRRSR